ncbi:hypothetical protein QTP70_027585 [Hemibagrus guttatus]|uniref:Uncharacterized protein n=1 Tax=Hemibagrus guttatus TaxID=175788 RepID=A0AAE0UMN7_9TELE|nr:hypothetical protein QTP70_027585 [Hemibagrus guttatus]
MPPPTHTLFSHILQLDPTKTSKRAGKMGKRKDLSEFDKGQIVMARPLYQSIPKTAALVGCSWSAVVSIYQKWFKEGTVVNQRQPRLNDARGKRRLARVVRCITDELLLLKLLKKLMVLIERCQNTQCMTGQGCFGSKMGTNTILGRWSLWYA